jgi:hypothetical protein
MFNYLNNNQMKKVFLFLAGLFILSGVYAQNTTTTAADSLLTYTRKDTIKGWHHFGLTSLTFGQTSLTNWVAGGNNSVSGDFVLNGSMNYTNDKFFWDNNLFLEYGLMYSSASVPDWMKAADKLNLTSIAGRKISKTWSYSALLSFYTQFAKGYNYPTTDTYISNLMAPGYLDLALGFTYKPNNKYSVFLSPLTERATFVLDDTLSNRGAFGVDPGKKSLFQTGAYVLATTTQTIDKNFGLMSSLDLFTPYSKDFGHIDVNWNLLLNYKINNLFTASLSTSLRYYEKEIEKIQFKEIFGLGLAYKF